MGAAMVSVDMRSRLDADVVLIDPATFVNSSRASALNG